MRYLIIVLSVLVLTACTGEAFRLSKPDGETVAFGTLKPRLNPPHQLTIVLDDKTYEGDVDSREMDIGLDELRKRYGASSKRYHAIIAGLNYATYHLHHYQGTLRAADGTTLTCDFLSSDDDGKLGDCMDGKGRTYEVRK